MAPHSSRDQRKMGGMVALVVAVLCVGVSLPTPSAASYQPTSPPDPSPPPPYKVDRCNAYYYVASPDHQGYFLQRDATGKFLEMPCAPGTIFDPKICVCVHDPKKPKVRALKPPSNMNVHRPTPPPHFPGKQPFPIPVHVPVPVPKPPVGGFRKFFFTFSRLKSGKSFSKPPVPQKPPTNKKKPFSSGRGKTRFQFRKFSS